MLLICVRIFSGIFAPGVTLNLDYETTEDEGSLNNLILEIKSLLIKKKVVLLNFKLESIK